MESIKREREPRARDAPAYELTVNHRIERRSLINSSIIEKPRQRSEGGGGRLFTLLSPPRRMVSSATDEFPQHFFLKIQNICLLFFVFLIKLKGKWVNSNRDNYQKSLTKGRRWSIKKLTVTDRYICDFLSKNQKSLSGANPLLNYSRNKIHNKFSQWIRCWWSSNFCQTRSLYSKLSQDKSLYLKSLLVNKEMLK